jgi:hypothetical protein
MPLPALTPEEYDHCLRACAVLRLPAQMPTYFRDLLVQSAEPSWPELAETIGALSAADLGDLYGSLWQWQAQRS